MFLGLGFRVQVRGRGSNGLQQVGVALHSAGDVGTHAGRTAVGTAIPEGWGLELRVWRWRISLGAMRRQLGGHLCSGVHMDLRLGTCVES